MNELSRAMNPALAVASDEIDRLTSIANELVAVLEEAMTPYPHARSDETNPPWVPKARVLLAKIKGAT